MKAFAFSLEKVLKLRKHYEDEAKIELGRAISLLADLEQRLVVLGGEIIRAKTAQFDPENTAIQMQQYMFYLIRLHNIKEQLLVETAKAEQKVEETREAFLEASRERKVLDKLKEKRQEEHKHLMLVEETNALDDIFAARAKTVSS
jgi:flagellar FliJ protein